MAVNARVWEGASLAVHRYQEKIMAQRDIAYCHPLRIAIGTFCGSLRDVSAVDPGAVVVRKVLSASGLPVDIAGGQGIRVGDRGALNAGGTR